MDLLYKGAKCKQINSNRRSLSNPPNCISLDADTKHNLKQTILNNNCQLETKTLLVCIIFILHRYIVILDINCNSHSLGPLYRDYSDAI